MNIVLFEDSEVSNLYPITLARPAYAIKCGALTLVDLALLLAEKSFETDAASPGKLQGSVRSELNEFQQDYSVQDAFADSCVSQRAAEDTLWLNARLVPDVALLDTIQSCLQNGEAFQMQAKGHVAAALTASGDQWQPGLPLDAPMAESACRLFEFPHQVIAEHTEILSCQLITLTNAYDYQEIQDGVYKRGEPSIHPHTVLDATKGPIVIEDGVTVSPFSVVQGPIRIGSQSFIAPHALLKGPISIGDHCKVGGEVSKSVIESYSNKVHYGYLGSSYLGSWVNLGAGTTNSNLKNTYGSVRVEYEAGKQDTGMQFLGCVIGDFTKTAIHASIFTGKILGVCSNVYGTVTTNVPSFSNYARSLGEVTEHPAEIMEVTQKRVFERRGIQQQARHKQLIQDMYAIEAPKRKLANKPPSL